MIDSIDPSGSKPPFKKKGNQRPKENASPSLLPDRLPPHSVEAEQGVLGCMLQNPHENIGFCIEKLKAGPEVFYDIRHRNLYEFLADLYDAKEAIDLITVPQKLKDLNLVEEVGGVPYVATLMDKVPSAANLPYYLEIVWEKYILRKVLQTCTQVIQQVHEHEGQVDALLDEVERDILKISQDRAESGTQSIRDLVHKAINTIEEFHQRQGQLTGVSTGFPDFDKMTSGLHGGEMIVIAARPSMGKTSLAMNIAESVAIDQNLPVGVFSLEMTSESLVLRMICSRARVNLRNIRDGFLAERDFPKLTAAAGRLAKSPLHIDDTPGLSVLQMRARARRMAQQYGIKLFVIDYLQLLHSSSRKAENRQQEIADISNGVKALAKELNVPVIVLSQLNRELEKDKNRKPRLSDLRESGSIEQDADLVGLLYKVAGSGEEEEPGDAGGDQSTADSEAVAVNLLIAKQRNGPTGDVELTFMKSYTRYESRSKIDDADVVMG